MATGYEPNIEGAIAVLVDLMRGNGFTMSRQPYDCLLYTSDAADD